MTTAIDVARGVLADLEAERAALAERRNAAAEVRKALAYAAHAASDGDARQRLDAANLEAANLQVQAEALDAAIEEARRRLAAAEDATARAGEIAKAEAVEHSANEIERLAADVDTHAHALRLAVLALQDHAHRVAITGWPGAPNFRAAQLAIGRALSAHLAGIGGFELPLLSPSQKRSAAQAVAVMVATARAGAARVLGKKAAA